MVTNLSQATSSKQTAKNVLFRLVSPALSGTFRDNYWNVPNQIFRSIRAMGGEVEIERSEYFGDMAGKRWTLLVTACGHTFHAILTASFADKPNGEQYDLTFVCC